MTSRIPSLPVPRHEHGGGQGSLGRRNMVDGASVKADERGHGRNGLVKRVRQESLILSPTPLFRPCDTSPCVLCDFVQLSQGAIPKTARSTGQAVSKLPNACGWHPCPQKGGLGVIEQRKSRAESSCQIWQLRCIMQTTSTKQKPADAPSGGGIKRHPNPI